MVKVAKTGHAAFDTPNMGAMRSYYIEILGLTIVEKAEDGAVYVRCGPDYHSVVLYPSDKSGLRHVAFQLRDWTLVEAACDLLARRRIHLIRSLGRHGIGHNILSYHEDPDGNVAELFTELDLMLDENLGYFEPRPWHEGYPQRPKMWEGKPQAANKWEVLPSEWFIYTLGLANRAGETAVNKAEKRLGKITGAFGSGPLPRRTLLRGKLGKGGRVSWTR